MLRDPCQPGDSIQLAEASLLSKHPNNHSDATGAQGDCDDRWTNHELRVAGRF
jgi:hypothetical protein